MGKHFGFEICFDDNHQVCLFLYPKIWPRTYPPRFAKKICDLMPGLKKQGEGKPAVSDGSVLEELATYEWTDWPEASLKGTVHYLYGNVLSTLPQEWKECFPRRV